MDNSLDIFVRIIAQQTGEDPKVVLRKLQEEIRNAAREGIKAEEALKAATDNTFTSKKQLKDMLKQLGHEFPLLSQVGRLALNPIALTTASITASITTLNYRVEELTKSLGGVALPDVTEDDITRVERMAKAYGALAEKILASGTNAANIKKNLDDIKATIEGNAAFFQAMGIDLGTGPTRAVAAATGSAEAALRASGANKLAAAGSISAENTQPAEFAKLAAAAQAQIPEIQKRIAFVQRAQGRRSMFGFNPMKWYDDFLFGAKFDGAGSYEEVLQREQGNLSQQQEIIANFGAYSRNRASRLALRAGGMADLAAADELQGTRRGLQFNIASGGAGAAMGLLNGGAGAAGDALNSGNFIALVRAAQDIKQGMTILAQAVKDLQEANRIAKSVQNNRARQQ